LLLVFGSVVSEICALRIEHAIKLNKRLVPVVWREVSDNGIHTSMAFHNWIFLS